MSAGWYHAHGYIFDKRLDEWVWAGTVFISDAQIVLKVLKEDSISLFNGDFQWTNDEIVEAAIDIGSLAMRIGKGYRHLKDLAGGESKFVRQTVGWCGFVRNVLVSSVEICRTSFLYGNEFFFTGSLMLSFRQQQTIPATCHSPKKTGKAR